MKTNTMLQESDRAGIWHPFAAAGAGLILILATAQAATLPLVIAFGCGSVFGLRLLRVRVRQTLGLLRYFLWMLPVTFVMHLLFSHPGWAFLQSLGHGTIQWHLLAAPAVFTLRIFGFLYIMGGLFQLIRADRLLESLFRVLQPLQKWHIPVNGVLQILNVGIRFFPLLREEMQQMQEVARGLGVGESRGLRGRIRAQLRTVTPLFVGTLHRGEVLAQMMVLRGYRPDRMRTTYSDVAWHPRDSLLIGAALAAGILVLL